MPFLEVWENKIVTNINGHQCIKQSVEEWSALAELGAAAGYEDAWAYKVK